MIYWKIVSFLIRYASCSCYLSLLSFSYSYSYFPTQLLTSLPHAALVFLASILHSTGGTRKTHSAIVSRLEQSLSAQHRVLVWYRSGFSIGNAFALLFSHKVRTFVLVVEVTLLIFVFLCCLWHRFPCSTVAVIWRLPSWIAMWSF